MTGNFNRRTFLGSAGALAGSIAFGGANPARAAVRSPAGPGAAGVLVEVGGEFMPGDWLGGGIPQAEVILQPLAAEFFQTKNNGATRFSEVEVSVPLFRWKNLWPWVQETAAGRVPKRNASVAIVDQQGVTIHHLAILNAFITELRFPKADAAASREPGHLTLKLVGDRYQFLASSRPAAPPRASAQQAPASNFVLQIQGLEKELAQAVWVVPPDMRMQAAMDQGSTSQRDATFSPQRPSIGPLKFSVPFVPGPGNALRHWCENALLGGRPERRPGVLSYFSSTRKEEIARVGFVDLLPYRFEIDQEGAALRMNVDCSVKMITVT